MMYNNKLAVALKSAGKVLREFKDEVYVPFGNEYSVYIKNMNSVRALVKVSVDGVDVGDGTKFVVDANDSIDIERFIKNGNFDEGNRLKFMERTGAIEDHRGIDIEDGLVRVEFNFEKPPVNYFVTPYVPPKRDRRWDDDKPWYTYYGTSNIGIGNAPPTSIDVSQATFTASASSGLPSNSITTTNVSHVVTDTQENDVENDVGITVPGSISDQQFRVASWFATETDTRYCVEDSGTNKR